MDLRYYYVNNCEIAMYKTLIDSETLAENLDNSDWTIVDCRYDLMDGEAGQMAWLASHIPGAVYASVSGQLSGNVGGLAVTDNGRHPMPAPETMIKTFSELGIDSSKQVVVYDDTGGAFAARLWWMLRYMQHDAVAVLDGGWSGWVSGNRQQESGEISNQVTEFSGEPAPERLVVIDQVSEVTLLIDSRDPDRYQGKLEPIDRAAGHVPGAINHFWQNNLNEDGRFHSSEQLAENFKNLLAETASEDAVFYCGSGVTACHNLLAIAHAGLAEPRLYGGSWSEWSSDPERPVATGPE